ncbi:unnamed protein product [Mytilus coruscus]|uniref:Peptidase C76 domain-containing protein n=1 Tax=Mytilus coruscus TaxID=42192 RepID=A0A6J8AEC5_MYTCO|nr:unnamed protein product [Mytilus coruscus]
MKQFSIQEQNTLRELIDETESMTVETNNTQLDCSENFITEIGQGNQWLNMDSKKINGTIAEDSIEVSRSIVDNWVVQGSFHQGDKRFGINSGKQCVANCLSALAHSKLKDLNDWDSMYLDNVLIDGNRMYSNIHGNNIHLLVSELPEISEISEKLFKISRKESITAVVDTSGTIDFGEFGNSLPLDQALQESLIDYDACFICAYDTTFLALKHNQDLLLFDSHARNEFGMKDSDGKSLLLKLSNLDHLYQYCCNMMAGASQNQWFEVTGVSICIYVQEPENNIDYEHDELSQIHKPVIISDFEIPKIPETGNRNSDEFLKTLENNMLSDHISPEILKFNICSDNSNVFKENNEVHFDEGIMDNESDVEILSSSEMFYDFRPLNTFSKRKLCTIVKIPTKKISKLVTSNIYNMGSPSATKTITVKKNDIDRKSDIATKKSKIDKSQMTYSINNLDDNYDESKVLPKAEKERIRYRIDDEFRARKTNTLKKKILGK